MLNASLHMSGLPDPATDPAFYEGVNSKRLVAFGIDVVLIFIIAFVVMTAFGALTLGLGLLLTGPIVFSIGLAYRTLTLAASSSTLGMLFVGL